jgi:uncharacterized protein YxeA
MKKIVVVLVVIIVWFGSILAAWRFSAMQIDREFDGASKAMNQVYSQIKSGDLDSAYSNMNEDFRKTYTKEAYTQMVKKASNKSNKESNYLIYKGPSDFYIQYELSNADKPLGVITIWSIENGGKYEVSDIRVI